MGVCVPKTSSASWFCLTWKMCSIERCIQHTGSHKGLLPHWRGRMGGSCCCIWGAGGGGIGRGYNQCSYHASPWYCQHLRTCFHHGFLVQWLKGQEGVVHNSYRRGGHNQRSYRASSLFLVVDSIPTLSTPSNMASQRFPCSAVGGAWGDGSCYLAWCSLGECSQWSCCLHPDQLFSAYDLENKS